MTDPKPLAGTAQRPDVDGDQLPFELTPIRRISVFRSIISQLDRLIDTLEPGARLGSERELSEQLGVSRISVREALRALESMGRIEIRRNSGSYVTEDAGTHQHLLRLTSILEAGGVDSINDLIAVREAIETAVVEAVAARRDADLDTVRQVFDLIDAEVSGPGNDESGSLDLRFEAALGRQADNALLTHFQRLVHELWVSMWLDLGGAVKGRRRLHLEHEAILDALTTGDGHSAVRLMAQHVNPRRLTG